VIFGHTGFYYPYSNEYKIGVDTAACFLETQPLTAFCIENNSENCRQLLKEELLCQVHLHQYFL
jgi:hypothetical protein